MTHVSIPACEASSRPFACGRFARTRLTSAGKSGSRVASIRQAMFDPRPEISTATRRRSMSELQMPGSQNPLAARGDRLAEADRALACLPQAGDDGLCRSGRHDDDEPDATVERA